MEIYWNIPTQGDGRYLGTSVGARELTPWYMQQVAQATGVALACAFNPPTAAEHAA